MRTIYRVVDDEKKVVILKNDDGFYISGNAFSIDSVIHSFLYDDQEKTRLRMQIRKLEEDLDWTKKLCIQRGDEIQILLKGVYNV